MSLPRNQVSFIFIMRGGVSVPFEVGSTVIPAINGSNECNHSNIVINERIISMETREVEEENKRLKRLLVVEGKGG